MAQEAVVELGAGAAGGPRTAGPRPAIIGPDVRITGSLKTEGAVTINGYVSGDIRCASLVVGETAHVEGEIAAESVVVRGKVFGHIRSKQVMLHASAHVEGDIFHQGIGIEMGTRYDGRLTWIDEEQQDVSQFAPQG